MSETTTLPPLAVAFGADHAGVALKDTLAAALRAEGFMSIAANRHPAIRCAVAHDVTSARLSRAHNNANVLALGARLVGELVALDCLHAFIATGFEGGRHAPRVAKLGLAGKPAA